MHARPLTTTVLLGCLAIAGCRTPAPIHVWASPQLQSAVDRTVVMATIVGERDIAQRLQEAVFAARPPEAARHVRLIGQAELQQRSEIQLASATENIPSDVALLSEARRHGIDYLLLGEILERREAAVHRPQAREQRPDVGAPASAEDRPSARGSATPTLPDADDRLTVSWRLIDVSEARLSGGIPVTVTRETAVERYADLATKSIDAESLLTTAAARETWRLLAPHVRRTTVDLAEPRLVPGSAAVREGNAHAEAMRWDLAARQWQAVLERHPRNHAALHNLALAAAARQDFVLAKSLAQQALRLHRSRMYERTVVWIETRHREMVAAFDLPPPAEGWLFAPDDPPAEG